MNTAYKLSWIEDDMEKELYFVEAESALEYQERLLLEGRPYWTAVISPVKDLTRIKFLYY